MKFNPKSLNFNSLQDSNLQLSHTKIASKVYYIWFLKPSKYNSLWHNNQQIKLHHTGIDLQSW